MADHGYKRSGLADPPPARLAAAKNKGGFGLVITQKSRWVPGVEVDIVVRVRSRAKLEAAAEQVKLLGVRAFAALEAAEDDRV